MDLIDINKKLIGEITPVGDSDIDAVRGINLKNHMELAFNLISEMIEISKMIKDERYSVMQAASNAKTYLEFINHEINQSL